MAPRFDGARLARGEAMSRPLGIRWTIGDVSLLGFEALRLSIWGAWRIFRDRADYCVVVNTIGVARARRLVGTVPGAIAWRAAEGGPPGWLRGALGPGMAEGVAWKLVPPRCFPDRRELSLDNDVVLWDVPDGLRDWLADDDPARCLLAEDVTACFGTFASLCGSRPLNAGIRGLPAGFDLEARLRAVLDFHPAVLESELDEQGLQVSALCGGAPPRVVSLADVSVCSPFPPHHEHPGRCGAHFVGLNSRRLGWMFYGEPAERVRARHWYRHREPLHDRVVVARDDAPGAASRTCPGAS
jgi:hypothetical protein